MAFIKQDRFGNRQAVIGLVDKKGNGYPRGFVKIKGKNYRVEFTESNKEGVEKWVTLTEIKPRGANGSNNSL